MDHFEYNRPNTRARIAARRRRMRVPPGESGVLPGPRRTLGWWLASGKIGGLLLLAASLGGLWHVSTSPQFTVRDIRVEGAQALSEDEVVQLASARGMSIWLVDTGQVAARLRANAYVERAEASLALPDRLDVRLTERRPEVRWRAGGVNFLVDSGGLVLGVDQSAALTNTLVIEDRSGHPLQPNDHVDPDALRLSQLIAVRLPAEVGLTPASIAWDQASGVLVTTADGRTIVFGASDQFDHKLSILGILLKEGAAFTYLDLRPTTPYYRNDPPGGAPQASP
ncbi:MAG TPA: FtsQ-type POTRA domain-containing protein [Roseiflexaceae bacterium]|nr:FtsQ-type POTRA domain-containing protein [Roseiflexaceae bacterium]